MFGFGQVFSFYMHQTMLFGIHHGIGGFIQDGSDLGTPTAILFFMVDVHLIEYITKEHLNAE